MRSRSRKRFGSRLGPNRCRPSFRNCGPFERGGFVGGNVAELGLLRGVRIVADPQSNDVASLDRELAAGAIEVVLAVPQGTLVTIQKRKITCQGREPVVWRLAAPKSRSYGHENRDLVQRPGDLQDLFASPACRRGPGRRLSTR